MPSEWKSAPKQALATAASTKTLFRCVRLSSFTEMGEVCKTCGLPHELCVCEDIDKSDTEVSITTEERSYGKEMTIIEGFGPEIDVDDLASELKSSLGCGGTTKDGRIELQGNHTDSIRELLDERGIPVE